MTNENENKPEIFVSVTEKKCGKCLAVKPATDFWKMRSSRDGLQPQCKNCQLGIAPKPVENKVIGGTKEKLETFDTIESAEKASKKVSKKKNPIGSGRRNECTTCTYQIKSTEGGRCISEAAEKDGENKAKICPHLVVSKTAKKKVKKAKKGKEVQ